MDRGAVRLPPKRSRSESIFDFSERELIEFAFSDEATYANAFSFMLETAIGYRHPLWEVECFLSVPRKELGLGADGLPGDVDVLLVPTFDGNRFAERTIAIEVKKFVVPRTKRGRSPGTYGVNQTLGLLSDGFPLVGLLHIALVEQSSDSDLISIPIRKTQYRAGDDPFDGSLLHDPAIYEVTRRHIGRMEKFKLPPCVGHKVQTLHVTPDESDICGWSIWGWKAPKKNPSRCVSLLEQIRRLERPPHYRVKKTHAGIEIFSGGYFEID